MDIIEQIKDYFRANDIKQGDIALACDWKKSFVSELLNGKRAIGNETAIRLNKAYKFDIHWLLTGEGTMFRVDATASTEEEEIAKKTDMYKAVVEENQRLREENEELKKRIERLEKMVDRLLDGNSISPCSVR